MTAWLGKIWKAVRRPSGQRPKIDETVGVGHYGNNILFALHLGFFVLNRDEFEQLRLRALSPSDQAEYRKLSIYAGGRELSKLQLEQDLCRQLEAEISRPGESLVQRRRIFAGETLEQGILIAVGALEWSLRSQVTIERLTEPTPGILISGAGERVFVPEKDLESVALWPDHAVFRYPGSSIHLNFLEPEWTAFA
ncbi:MAG: hypothetical protein EOR00_27160 [Mesorhizobium sp.]|uniref:hypothetical protein n=1 Tax=Mesorhizobium sp. TaxID=1871066 RepID=UPI000FE9A4A7|nr:hypothetical protein [Mesorhizobium sp.]RWP12305.1 MAG: hypothetical protein EOR00_27160 [Mesorhizobium sp.]